MRAKKRKVMRSRITATSGNRSETTLANVPAGQTTRQHQDVVPSSGQGPQGTVGVMVPFGAAPPVPPPPVGAGRGFKGW